MIWAMTCAWLSVGATSEKVPYSVATQLWDAGLGHHRAIVRVEKGAPVVWVHIPWRRRDHNAAGKNIVVLDAATGKRIRNVVRAQINREAGDVLFAPATAPGDYYIYYLPYIPDPAYGGYRFDYVQPENTADAAWVQQNSLAPESLSKGAWRSLPQAKVVELQARAEFERFDPMEVVATADELKAFVARFPDRPCLLFPEDRVRPIRMTDDLPLRWIENGPAAEFSGQAQRNEFYAFQIGVYAPRQELHDLAIDFEDLRHANQPAVIPAKALRCINLGGIDWEGRPFKKAVHVAQGKVQALWFGIDIAKDAAAGPYTGRLVLRAKETEPIPVTIRLEVRPEVLEDRGDGQPWRHSRLAWLDSTIGIDDEVTAPYTPLAVEGQTVQCLGRKVRLSPTGLPESITSGRDEILAEPMRFVIQGSDGEVRLPSGKPEFVKQASGTIEWESRVSDDRLSLACRAHMEFDGHITYRLTLKPTTAMAVDDLRLEVPYRREVAGYILGIGRKGGFRPKEWSWKWGGAKYYDSFWLGNVHAGLMCELRGASYCGPMVNLYWSLKQLDPPATWHNGGKGGCTVTEVGDSQVLVKAYSGPRQLLAGQEITFEFALLATPVKPLDTAAHFRSRYYHDVAPIDTVAKAGGNVINVHHANEYNPFINYPFIANDKLSGHVKAAHEKGMKLKIYYTVRELTNHVTELWALRSLGNEVLAPGGGGGFPWLKEHLVTGYTPSWYSPFPDGSVCASVVTSGASRWYNYYIEGLGWLVKNIQIDGLYLDDVTYDRQIIKRMRKVMDRNRPGCMIDLHSNTGFSQNPAIQYMEYFPFIDRLWFGESFNYDDPPDYWLVEITGIPFGLMGDMLQDGGNRWRGMLYGMTSRIPWSPEPAKMWKLWDAFGIGESRMIGYWEPDCPVRTDHPEVLATAYVKKDKTLISLASWARIPVKVRLTIDFGAIGLNAGKAHLFAPAVQDFQEATLFGVNDAVTVMPGRGWLFIVDHETHDAPAYRGADASAGGNRRVLAEGPFPVDPQGRLAAPWRAKLSSKPGTRLDVQQGELRLTANAHHCVFVERDLPKGVTMVECRIDSGTDQGMTWGSGLGLVWKDRFLRFNVRPTEGRLGIDDGQIQMLVDTETATNKSVWLRLRLEPDQVFAEVSLDGKLWWVVRTMQRESYAGDPIAVRLGKMRSDGTLVDADATPNPVGTSAIGEFRVFGGV